MLMPTDTLAIAGRVNTSADANTIVPISNFFILWPPLFIAKVTS